MDLDAGDEVAGYNRATSSGEAAADDAQMYCP